MGHNQLILILCLFVFAVSTQVDEKSSSPCNDPKASEGVRQEGCLVQTCQSGRVVESLAKECVDFITESVDKIIDEKLAEKDVECSSESEPPQEIGKYKIPGIIVAGGEKQKKVKLVKPDTKEVCDLPDLPSYFTYSSINLLDGTPVLCGSWDAKWSKARMKNETEPRKFKAATSCVQLSPASKDAQWTIFTENKSNHRDCVSLTTPDGILLMGGHNSRRVDLLKPDGSYEYQVFVLSRMIDRACGIEDEGTLIITGGGSNGFDESMASNVVQRYNRQGYVEDLPQMNHARTEHGCGFYHKDGKKVLVVAGGYYGWYQKISSTETHVLGSPSWTSSSPLPRRMFASASVSMNDKIYILGREVYQFDGDSWEETQTLGWRGLESGNRAIAVDLATSGFGEFCN